MKKLFTMLLSLLIILVVYIPGIVFAGNTGGSAPCPQGSVCIPNPLRNAPGTLYDFIVAVINDVILPIGGVIVTLAIIYAGFLFVTARGDETKLKSAKSAFFSSVIGALILLGSWAIALAIQATVNQLQGP
jgi:hypothetical protein